MNVYTDSPCSVDGLKVDLGFRFVSQQGAGWMICREGHILAVYIVIFMMKEQITATIITFQICKISSYLNYCAVCGSAIQTGLSGLYFITHWCPVLPDRPLPFFNRAVFSLSARYALPL